MLHVGGVFIAKQRLFAAGLCVVLAVALYLFLHFTRPGKAMRAVEQDREAALLMGISSEQVYLTAFVISAALAAVGGAMLGSLFGIDPEMGAEPLLKSFIIVQIGGMGSIAGTVIAGLFIGLSDSVDRHAVRRRAGVHHRLRDPDADPDHPAAWVVRLRCLRIDLDTAVMNTDEHGIRSYRALHCRRVGRRHLIGVHPCSSLVSFCFCCCRCSCTTPTSCTC